MPGRLSLRAQLALALGLVLFFGGALNAVAGAALLHRLAAGAASTQKLASALSLWFGYLVLDALLTFIFGTFLLARTVGRPVERLAAAAERIGRLELDDPLEQEGPVLGRLGVAFERMAQSLKEERDRTAQQIEELRRLNQKLAEARDSLVRSEKLATVGRLAAGVAHEIGNPLGAILGYLELAQAKAPPEAGEHLAAIDREVARIDRTIRELLDFSRPGEKSERLAPLGLREAVEAAQRLAAVQRRVKAVCFELAVPEELKVLADGHLLSQVLVNVFLNAGDAMAGEGRILVKARRSEAPVGRRASDPPAGPRVELSVDDTGPGIRPEDLSRIFDPFFTTKQPGEGTGLGLAICHRIMEGFGGEIRAENRPEGGATFTLIFREA